MAAPSTAAERLALIGRDEQRTQAAETVGIDQAEIDQLAERVLDLRAQQAAFGDDFIEEGGAVSLQHVEDSRRARARLEIRFALPGERHPERG